MDVAGAGFGRIDYTVVDGQVVVFEINSNPAFPGADKDDPRQERRRLVRERLVEAFERIDSPVAPAAPVRFRLPEPQSHDLCPPSPFHQIGRALRRHRLIRGATIGLLRVSKAMTPKTR
jgi:hypothetical protein